MENKKVTNRMALEFVLGLEVVQANEEIFEKLTKMLEQNEKKSNAGKSGKLTKAQEENEGIKNLIMGALDFEPKQIKELQLNENLKDFSNQKLSALLRQMVLDGIVFKVQDKKVSKFYLCNEPEKVEIGE